MECKYTLENIDLPSSNAQAVKNMIEYGDKIQKELLHETTRPITYSWFHPPPDIKNIIKERYVSEMIPGEKYPWEKFYPWEMNMNKISELCNFEDLMDILIYNKISYFKQYESSYFAYTWQKGGWDCNRHAEILGSGCIPYMIDIEQCPQSVMCFYPKKLMKYVLNLPGIIKPTYKDSNDPPCQRHRLITPMDIDKTIFSDNKYMEILDYSLKFTSFYLNPYNKLRYIIRRTNLPSKILFLCNDEVDYLTNGLLYTGRVELGNNFVDYPRCNCMYPDKKSTNRTNFKMFISFYLKSLPCDHDVDRTDIENKIKTHYFDVIITSTTFCEKINPVITLFDLARKIYTPEDLVFVDGRDCPGFSLEKDKEITFYRRETFNV